MRIAGLLHDIGKIGIPDAILRKPGKLTEDEYEVMKSHVTLSALIIHGLPHMNDILDAVANHHERWDGKGYPQGLTGEQIPFLGRIMAIADAFSAMTLDRPYRAAMGTEAAIDQIERGMGTQFDPTLAQLFIETLRAGAPATEREVLKAA
jgi:HD-GYP domain-containing protein (c-di-GMP phosphodiesterase class II)